MMSWDYYLYLSGREFTPVVSIHKKDIKIPKLLIDRKPGSLSRMVIPWNLVGNGNPCGDSSPNLPLWDLPLC